MFTNLSAQLYINEFMASNDTAFPGPQGDYPDWIEIYNNGAEAVMLGGYYLSDKLDDPSAMFQIPNTYPDSVTVPAAGFILFYANKGQETSVLNLNFKLKGSGEAVGLWNPESVFLDSLSYDEQISDTSYGRYTDGTDNWFMMPDYSPGESNRYTLSIGEIEDLNSISQNFPNPFSMVTNIQFTLGKRDNVVIKVFDVRGSLVTALANDYYSEGTHTIKWNESDIPSGYYFYSLQTSTGVVTKKASIIK